LQLTPFLCGVAPVAVLFFSLFSSASAFFLFGARRAAWWSLCSLFYFSFGWHLLADPLPSSFVAFVLC
jgi:hypothetical protein